MLNFNSDLIGIWETKIKKGIDPNFNVEINSYRYLATPAESDEGGVIIYIAKHHDCKPRDDLHAINYKTCAVESEYRVRFYMQTPFNQNYLWIDISRQWLTSTFLDNDSHLHF